MDRLLLVACGGYHRSLNDYTFTRDSILPAKTLTKSSLRNITPVSFYVIDILQQDGRVLQRLLHGLEPIYYLITHVLLITFLCYQFHSSVFKC